MIFEYCFYFITNRHILELKLTLLKSCSVCEEMINESIELLFFIYI